MSQENQAPEAMDVDQNASNNSSNENQKDEDIKNKISDDSLIALNSKNVTNKHVSNEYSNTANSNEHSDNSNENNINVTSTNTNSSPEKDNTKSKNNESIEDKIQKQNLLKEKVANFRNVITKGCGNWRCTNPYCYSNKINANKKYDERSASLLAIEMVKKHIKSCQNYPLRDVIPLRHSILKDIGSELSDYEEHDKKKDDDGDSIMDLSSSSSLKITTEMTSDDDSKVQSKLSILLTAFQHWDILELSFLTGQTVSEEYPEINFDELDNINNLIMSHEKLVNFCRDVLNKSLEHNKRGSTLIQLRTLIILLESPLILSEDLNCYDLLKKLLIRIDMLLPQSIEILKKWFSHYPDTTRLEKLLVPLQQYFTIRVLEGEESISEATQNWEEELNNPDQKEEYDDEIEKRQTKLRDTLIVEEYRLIVVLIDILYQANQKIIEDSANIKKNQNYLNNYINKINLSNYNNNVIINQITKEQEKRRIDYENNNDTNSNKIIEDGNNNNNNNNADKNDNKSDNQSDNKFERRESLKLISPYHKPIPYDKFYNHGLNEVLCGRSRQNGSFCRNDLRHFKEEENTFSFLKYSYLLDAGTKARYLEFENIIKQYEARRMELLRYGFHGLLMGGEFVMSVRRGHLIEDSLKHLDNVEEQYELKKRLRIEFANEQGIDQGGLTKEYFQLIMRELFDPIYGMFVENNETGTYWFKRDAFANEESRYMMENEYKLIGILIGIAIYNNTILDIRFPKVIFKKLLKKPIDFEDFQDFDPEMAKGFQQLLNFDGDVESAYCRNFSVKYMSFGIEKEDDLKENGAKIPLNNDNREEYVELYIKYLLQTSIENQFNAFLRGFETVCDSKLFKHFQPEELELLVCGSKKFDFEALQASTQYEDGFNKNSRVIQDFWAVVHSLKEDDKRKLLTFCTGSDRVPIKGLGELILTISKNGDDNSQLPTSHTCFNHLLLPEYSNKEILRQRLLTAIQNSEGFGLK